MVFEVLFEFLFSFNALEDLMKKKVLWYISRFSINIIVIWCICVISILAVTLTYILLSVYHGLLIYLVYYCFSNRYHKSGNHDKAPLQLKGTSVWGYVINMYLCKLQYHYFSITSQLQNSKLWQPDLADLASALQQELDKHFNHAKV